MGEIIKKRCFTSLFIFLPEKKLAPGDETQPPTWQQNVADCRSATHICRQAAFTTKWVGGGGRPQRAKPEEWRPSKKYGLAATNLHPCWAGFPHLMETNHTVSVCVCVLRVAVHADVCTHSVIWQCAESSLSTSPPWPRAKTGVILWGKIQWPRNGTLGQFHANNREKVASRSILVQRQPHPTPAIHPTCEF